MTPHPFSIKLDQTSVVPLNEQLTKALQEEIRHPAPTRRQAACLAHSGRMPRHLAQYRNGRLQTLSR